MTSEAAGTYTATYQVPPRADIAGTISVRARAGHADISPTGRVTH